MRYAHKRNLFSKFVALVHGQLFLNKIKQPASDSVYE